MTYMGVSGGFQSDSPSL